MTQKRNGLLRVAEMLERRRLRRLARLDVVHGETCEKKPHDNPSGGYLHGEDDDTPYMVDGWPYCGRCHRVL